MIEPTVRYRSPEEDSARWAGFEFRDGDIVISSRSKHGTTWTQMICALLVLQTPRLPAPLAELSPWLDWLVLDRDDLFRRLAAQPHRRFVKTHTPLDGVPLDDRVHYIVVARHPLDAAVSLYHQGANIDRDRLRSLTSASAPSTAAANPRPRPDLHDWLMAWVEDDDDPREQLDSLPGVLLHLRDAWSRRERPNVILLHYDDLRSDLDGQMRSLAARLGIDVPSQTWPDLVTAAGFDSMRGDPGLNAPNPVGVLKDPAAFFRRGTSGAAEEVLSAAEVDRYRRRVATLGPPDLLEWLHRGR